MQDLCNRCLRYNKSCSHAWELLGSAAEREQAYKEAVSHYEHAWQLANQVRRWRSRRWVAHWLAMPYSTSLLDVVQLQYMHTYYQSCMQCNMSGMHGSVHMTLDVVGNRRPVMVAVE
jgi:hypothetical protein